jgi:hypothetical protein
MYDNDDRGNSQLKLASAPVTHGRRDYLGIQQSRSCGLKQRKRTLRVPGVVAVGGGDIRMPVQAQQADGQATS